MKGGKLFQTLAAATRNARSPIVEYVVRGMTSGAVFTDRSRLQESSSATGLSLAEKYGGATVLSLMHFFPNRVCQLRAFLMFSFLILSIMRIPRIFLSAVISHTSSCFSSAFLGVHVSQSYNAIRTISAL